MKKILCLFAIVFCSNSSNAQNLIQNSSFEYYAGTCYCGGAMMGAGAFDDNTVIPSQHKIDNWYTFITPDYFNALCAVTVTNGVMYNEMGNISPKTGTAFVGFIGSCGSILGEVKEYIYQQLATPLIGGKLYCMSFYVSLADASTGAIEKVGAYFSNSVPSLNTSLYINVIPQIENQNGIISDTTNWVQVQGCFIANGGEQYLTIGNFNSMSNSNLLILPTNYTIASDYPGYAYYYIDDITLIDQTTVGLTELAKDNGLEVYPNPNNGSFTIDLKTKSQIIITNTLGETIFNQSLEIGKQNLSIQSKADGIYFVKVTDDKGFSSTKKIVVQK